jgi:hypothetical protein
MPNPHRVLKAQGEIAEGFHWGEPGRSDDPRELLEGEGIVFDANNRAAKKQRISAEQLRELLGDRAEDVFGPVAKRTPPRRRHRPAALIQPVADDGGVAAMEQAFVGRTDLRKPIYGSNARLLFAAELILDIPDIHSVAAGALIDGGDDKSCDFLHVDTDAGLIVLAQGYESGRPDRDRAKQSKAKGLHQAATWVFVHDLEKVPARIRHAVRQARQALDDGAIREVRIWYVHNLPESDHIAEELAAVETLVSSVLASVKAEVDVRVDEIGWNTLAAWCRASVTPILVTEEFGVDVESCLKEAGPNWNAYSVTVPASWLQGVHWNYGDQLFPPTSAGFSVTARRSTPKSGIPWSESRTIFGSSIMASPRSSTTQGTILMRSGCASTGCRSSTERKPPARWANSRTRRR